VKKDKDEKFKEKKEFINIHATPPLKKKKKQTPNLILLNSCRGHNSHIGHVGHRGICPLILKKKWWCKPVTLQTV
jgi:hypothetical protein